MGDLGITVLLPLLPPLLLTPSRTAFLPSGEDITSGKFFLLVYAHTPVDGSSPNPPLNVSGSRTIVPRMASPSPNSISAESSYVYISSSSSSSSSSFLKTGAWVQVAEAAALVLGVGLCPSTMTVVDSGTEQSGSTLATPYFFSVFFITMGVTTALLALCVYAYVQRCKRPAGYNGGGLFGEQQSQRLSRNLRKSKLSKVVSSRGAGSGSSRRGSQDFSVSNPIQFQRGRGRF